MKQKDILIVEDDLDLIEILKAFYALLPYSYDIVNSGEEALELVKDTYFKIFVLDINLGSGKMHGVDLAISLRKLDGSAKIYALTGHTGLFTNIKPEVAGFDKVYYKPNDYKHLLRRIDKELGGKAWKNIPE